MSFDHKTFVSAFFIRTFRCLYDGGGRTPFHNLPDAPSLFTNQLHICICRLQSPRQMISCTCQSVFRFMKADMCALWKIDTNVCKVPPNI
ncbi:hypothetical protein BaRGS_00002412 [Batillaria attramentaria]|uniref:Uncharacterized protein n=1 Tax=Batillaria attramentaria TaxID=370345 RepID=A0ABD0M338_9CAEN